MPRPTSSSGGSPCRVDRAQERFHSPLARRALATELHGQQSVRWITGEMAAPKAFRREEGSCAELGGAPGAATGVFYGGDSCGADATVFFAGEKERLR